MEDEWMEALHRYVSEGQWSEVSHFVDRNAVLFGGSSTEKEHGEGEYALYVQFRSLVAKVLDSLLASWAVGARRTRRGWRFFAETAESPRAAREEMAKRVLQDLLDIDDFAAFARTMRARNDELETGEAAELERQLSAADAKAARRRRRRSAPSTRRAEAEAEAHRRGDAAGPDGDGDGDIGDIGRGRRGARGAAPSAIAADLVAWCALEAELGTVQKRLHGMLGDDGASDQAKAAAVWKLAARRGADDKAAEDEGPKDGAYDAGGGAVSSDGDVLWHEFLDLDTNYCYYVNTATGESQWNPPDEFLPLDESVEVAAGLAEEQAAAYHAEAAHAAYKEELPTSEYWDEPKAAKDPPRAPEADAAPAEAKAEAKDDGPTFKVPERDEHRRASIEYEGKKMQFDAVYAGLSDEGFFAAAASRSSATAAPFVQRRGAEVSKAIAFFADAFETASAVDVREDRVWDVANGELAHASAWRLSSAGPAAADAMFESLKSRAMRTKHEEETGRLKRKHM
ncbi:hypothetical protein JL720_13909 [Aureococcus anophagefferens]|nr:hypothetical protein JL720_13909 [Aureococcus anophagefferens]